MRVAPLLMQTKVRRGMSNVLLVVDSGNPVRAFVEEDLLAVRRGPGDHVGIVRLGRRMIRRVRTHHSADAA